VPLAFGVTVTVTIIMMNSKHHDSNSVFYHRSNQEATKKQDGSGLERSAAVAFQMLLS
jgi:hypothetical protein